MQGMKTTRVATLISLLLFLTIRRVLLCFSLSLSLSQHHSLHFSEFVSVVTKPSILVLFSVFIVIIIAILLWIPKTSSSDHFDSFLYLQPLVCEVEFHADKAKDEDDNDNLLPRLVYVEYKGEKDFLLDYVDDNSDGFHGYDGYEEDNDDDDGDDDVSSEDEEDEDLKRRAEEFIAKNKKKWKEELLNDKFLRITAA